MMSQRRNANPPGASLNASREGFCHQIVTGPSLGPSNFVDSFRERGAGAWELRTSTRGKTRTENVTAQCDEATTSNGVAATDPIPVRDLTTQPALAIPTLPFQYFRLAISRLKAAGHLPHKIDRSAWSTKQFLASGALIVPAFRFLNLIDHEGRPQESLVRLIDSFGTEDWRARLAETLLVAYADTLGSDIRKLTPKDVIKRFKLRHDLDAVQGRMAVSFFVHATREADWDVGQFIPATVNPLPQNARMTAEKYQTEMLARLPPFEDSWSEELKLAWFTAFNKLTAPGK